MNDEDKKKLIKECLSKGLLFSPELGQKSEEKENIFYFENTKKINLSIQENKESAEIENTEEFLNKDVEILTSYGEKWKKKTIKDFFNHYSSRFKTLSQMLRRREELKGATAIKRISLRNQNESVATIGMVKSKRITKNDHILLVIEDLTGETSVLISKNKNTKEEGKDKSLYEEAKDICLDEVIGVLGNKGESDIIFASGLVWPDLPRGMEFKKSPVEEYAVFIGDTHFGSKHFLHKEFNLFLNWITGKIGSPAQKEMAKKIKYLFLVGDLIEGAGIYPNQEDDLEVKDIYKQYEIFSSFLKKIPESISIIICPGNHDPVRVHEPQPPIPQEYAKDIYALKNTYFVSSPASVRIGKKDNFKGLDVLLYHGYSFPFYADSVESIRQVGGLERVDKILEYLLKRRHFAPQHGSTQFVPDYEEDSLIIKNIPDILVTGHIHRSTTTIYKNITLLNCSCWIGQTEYQEKRGLKPQPAKATVINLKTRETKILSFAK